MPTNSKNLTNSYFTIAHKYICVVGHMEEYAELGHPYVSNYSLMPTFTWVLTMSPIMARIF